MTLSTNYASLGGKEIYDQLVICTFIPSERNTAVGLAAAVAVKWHLLKASYTSSLRPHTCSPADLEQDLTSTYAYTSGLQLAGGLVT